jgi:hypothetical protein
MQGNWVVKIGWWKLRIEVAGNIYLRRPGPTQSCTDDDGDKTFIRICKSLFKF